jgi:hypothetical protein
VPRRSWIPVEKAEGFLRETLDMSVGNAFGLLRPQHETVETT